MDTTTLIRDTLVASEAGRIHFGEVVQRMVQAGVESYAVDYRGRRVTYYLQGDDTLMLALAAVDEPIAPAFDATAIQAAIRGAQQGRVMYPAFKRLSMQAGCVGYVAWIAGRQVTYFGRKGEEHVERFPG